LRLFFLTLRLHCSSDECFSASARNSGEMCDVKSAPSLVSEPFKRLEIGVASSKKFGDEYCADGPGSSSRGQKRSSTSCNASAGEHLSSPADVLGLLSLRRSRFAFLRLCFR
uniref:Secreted protein n=1 Tax=Haemonchus placei TaxID=6290 RepID=A0A0N4WI27_HAEPC